MIVTVTAHPARDVTVSMPAMQAGETNRADAAFDRAGGKGINVARVVAALGHPVVAIAPLGADSREWFEGDLSGVELRAVPVGSPLRTTIAVHERDTSRTTLIAGSADPFSRAELAALVSAVDAALPRATCLVISGSVPPGTPNDLYGQLVAIALEAGMPALVDASGPQLRGAAEAGATVLKPNRRELLDTTGGTDPLVAARELVALGAGTVVVSLGADGMLSVGSDGSALLARLPSALPGNATGAGDAAVAAIAIARASGLADPEAVLRRAVALSASAVGMPRAGEVTPAAGDYERDVIVEVADR